jgi:hypothetical protein
MERYLRSCPQCATAFEALTEHGICPTCNLHTRIDRNGIVIAIEEVHYADNLPVDHPHANSLIANVFETLEYGGGRIALGVRDGDYPPVIEVQRQLHERFCQIVDSLRNEVEGIDSNEVLEPWNDPEWIGSDYEESLKLSVVTWFEEGAHFALVCSFSADGGCIDAIVLPN